MNIYILFDAKINVQQQIKVYMYGVVCVHNFAVYSHLVALKTNVPL